jgi:hypothetical protein
MSHDQTDWLGIDWDNLPIALPTLYSTYMWVWVALLVLTLVEVLVPDPHMLHVWGLISTASADSLAAMMPRWFVVTSLILLALAKTFCVAWYYMHLIDERPMIIGVACAPFIFSMFLAIGLWPQLPNNSAIKGEPGKDKDLSGGQSKLEQAPSQTPPSRTVTPEQGMKLADRALTRRK